MLYLWICDLIKVRRLRDLEINRTTLRFVLGSLAIIFFSLGVYLFLHRDPSHVAPLTKTWDPTGLPHYLEGPQNYLWALICLGSLTMNCIILYMAERSTSMTLRAILPLSVVYYLICFLVELLGVSRGWWVYNVQQVSGHLIGGVPLENLVVYLTAVVLPISIFEWVRKLLGESGLP